MFSKLNNAWYPVALSKDLKPGRHKKVQLFDTRWLLFRSKTGRLGMTSRYCCHLGTDLSNGSVIGDDIECPMHGWRFGTDGKCTLVPGGIPIPENARLLSLETEERFGIIFVFYGGKPLFDFPGLQDLSGDLKCSAPIVVPLQAPYHVAALNTFDTQHYERIHARRFVAAPLVSSPDPFCLRIDYTAEIIERRWVDKIMAKLTNNVTSVVIESWGGGVIVLKNKDTRYGSIVGVCPSSETGCELYIVALKERIENQPWMKSLIENAALNLAAIFLKSYLSPDLEVIRNMRPHQGVLLDGEDDALRAFFRYWQALPKTSVLESRNKKKVA